MSTSTARSGRHDTSVVHRIFRARALHVLVVMLLLPLTYVTALSTPAQAAQVGARSQVLDQSIGGFPTWYQDQAGTRLEPCLDPNDPNCVLATTAIPPYAFPDNFPDEFFYSIAESQIFQTPGCNTLPGKVSVRMALEGAFINGAPASGDQMVFGRTRITATGLCPNTEYTFEYPFGSKTLRTNDLGTIIRGVGTTDVGCVPTPGVLCDFDLARGSEVFGGPAGFLRWDSAVAPAAPAGYLGDGVTFHTITGGTARNTFTVKDSAGNVLVDANGAAMTTDQFVVAGKLAGPLSAVPIRPDFAGVEVGTTATKTVTLTNLDAAPLTINGLAVETAAEFAIAGGTCAIGTALARDESCTVDLTLAPAADAVTGVRTGTLVVSHDRYRSPNRIDLSGTVTNPGAQAVGSPTPDTLAFGDGRVRVTSAERTTTITNSGTAPLVVTGVELTNGGSGTGNADFQLGTDTCSIAPIPVGGTCVIGARFRPLNVGATAASIVVASNSVPALEIPLSGNGIGGNAAVSADINPRTGFPTWYRDEAGVKLAECIDPEDPYCIVLADPTFDPAQPVVFLDPTDPTGSTVEPNQNFPGEYFYSVTENAPLEVESCTPGAPGSVLIRHAVEAAFFNGDPAPHEQMTFSRVRVTARDLCANSEYEFVYPYGVLHITTNDLGRIAPNMGTNDIGCTPVAPDVCDFSLALQGDVLGGVLRWDPAVAPAAPAGYAGDAATPHKAIGAPFTYEGQPANFVKVIRKADPNEAGSVDTLVGETDQFIVMGKYVGPLEADVAAADFVLQPVGVTSNPQHVTLSNTGISDITLTAASIAGAEAADFAIAGGACGTALSSTPVTLAPGQSCTVDVTFTPTAVGDRAASLVIRHNGFNDPFALPLKGIGQAGAGTPAISFAPRTVTFQKVKAGRVSGLQTVTISNAGGQAPLAVSDPRFEGTNAADFSVRSTDCTIVEIGQTCSVQILFAPSTAGAKTANLVVTDNVNGPGSTHQIEVTGTATDVASAVAATNDAATGFPLWYQDENGNRVDACLDPADSGCIVLPGGTWSAGPVVFPTTFPNEFFYTIADSEVIATPGCPAAGVGSGTALLRLAVEGSFANGTPVPGDQITFTRIRVTVRGGLCPNAPYNFVTPYGPVTFQTDATGSVKAADGTIDTGCGAAPCTFADALTTPEPTQNATTPIAGFLRWDPNVAPAAPAGHLGDATSFHKVVGGTYVPADNSTHGAVLNEFQIRDSAGNLLVRTDRFLVSGRTPGPLYTATKLLDFPATPLTLVSGLQDVVVRNIGEGSSTVAASLAGADAAQFQLTDGCQAAVAQDATCTLRVAFAPTTEGTKSATLRIVAGNGQVVTVTLHGTATPAPAPVIGVSPGVIAFGTTTASAPLTAYTTVRNTGNAPLTITKEALTGTATADFAISTTATNGTAANCGALPVTVPQGGSCLIAVTFKPTAIGARTATLTLTHNDLRAGVNGTTAVSLTATGAGNTFTVANAGFTKVKINTNKDLTVGIRNSGTTPVALTSYAIDANPAVSSTITNQRLNNVAITSATKPFTVLNNGAGCLGTTLAAGKSCNITVRFRPTVVGGNYTATLSIKGDANSLPAIVTSSLTGSGA